MRDEFQLKNLRIAGLSVLSFLLMFSYSLARPATESMFLEAHSSESLPVVWLLVAVVITLSVAAYNRYVAGVELLKLYGVAAAVSALVLLLLLGCHRAGLPGVHYLLYTWKDVYIVVLVEIFYSFANTVFPIRTARWVYGLFGAIGAVGGILGNLSVGWLAAEFGTESALWATLPLLGITWLGCIPYSRAAGVGVRAVVAPGARNLKAAMKVVGRSRYLVLVLILIAVVQLAITLVDFEFNRVLEQMYPNEDVRTGIIGEVYAVISFITVAMHLSTGPFLRLVGIPVALLLVPFMMGGAVGALIVVRGFTTAAVLKITSKCLDYTWFRAAKECLYIPLDYTDTTMGKSVVDMFTYRIAKGATSLLLLGMIAVGAGGLVVWLVLAALVAWLLVAAAVNRMFRQKVSREEEACLV